MRHKSSTSLGWYVALSLLLHLLFMVWVLRSLGPASPGVSLYAPVRVTIVAPALPTGPTPGVGDRTPTLSPAHPRAATPDLTPPAPTPLVTATATLPPARPSPSAPPPQTREIDLPRPLTAVSAPAQVPELSTSAAPQPAPVPIPTVSANEPAQASLPSPTVPSIPAPRAPAPVASAPTAPPRPPDNRPGRVRVTVPRPLVVQREPQLRTVARVPQTVRIPPPAPEMQTPNTVMTLTAPARLQNPPLPPPSAVPRQEPADVPLAKPTPPTDTLPPAPALPSPDTSPKPKSPPAPPQTLVSAPSLSVPDTPAPVTPTAVVSAPAQPLRPPNARPVQEGVTLPPPQVAQRALPLLQAVAKAPQAVQAPASPPDMPTPDPAVVPLPSTPVQSTPPPPTPTPRRQRTHAPRTTPLPPPTDTLPAAPVTPLPDVSLTRVPPPATLPNLSTTTALPAPQPPPPPSTVAARPPSRRPQRQDRGTPSQDVIDTPQLDKPASGPAIPSRTGPGKPSLSARRQVPFESPPRFVYQPKPTYPWIARRRGWEGTVLLDIEMLADGTVGEIKIAKSSGYSPLDTAAQKAVKKWRHTPIRRNGVAVTRRAHLPIRFRLD